MKKSIKESSDAPILQDFGHGFSSPTFMRAQVWKLLAYSDHTFGATILRVAVLLMKSGMIIMENTSDINVMNDIPFREAMS